MSIRRDDIHTIDLSGVIEPDAEPIPAPHPGAHLAEILDELGVSQYRLAQSISVSPRRINEIVKGQRAITADTALRLGRFFGMSAGFWLGLQADCDRDAAERALGDRLESEVEPLHH